MTVKTREMSASDIPSVATIHQESFRRQNNSTQWITCNYNAQPRTLMYVAELNSKIIGYIQWLQKSGFRSESVIELEQIAVLEEYRSKNIGKNLITESLDFVKKYLSNNGSMLKGIIVTTRTDNHAKKIYESTLGVKEEFIIKDLYSADESVLIVKM
jgi:ribosomal protein S18 acetylase RimI-like enzyme